MISEFEVTADHAAHREDVREFCEEVRPRVEGYEERGEFPEALVRRLGREGLTGVPFPEDVGGAGGDYRDFAVTVEELARTWKLLAGHVNIACGLVGYPIAEWGADWQREEWLGAVCAGDAIPALALTEPGAGSDAAAVETTAERDGDEWVLEGHKWWTTHGSVADLVVVAARTVGAGDDGEPGTDGGPGSDGETEGDDGTGDDGPGDGDDPPGSDGGISLIGVPDPREREGFEVVRDIDCMEGETAVESELRFDGLRVPAENVVGEAGRGFRYVMEALDVGRVGTAAQGVGLAQAALDAATAFADEREQFGRPVREFQGVGFKLADVATATEAARLLTLRAADRRDRGERITTEAAMAKAFATDAAMEATTEAVQVLGARGYSTEYPVERYMREAKGTQIYDGTNEINRQVVADGLYE